jgi:arylsulfatase A-like enzyme
MRANRLRFSHFALAALLGLWDGTAAKPAVAANPPNIIVILTDDQDLGSLDFMHLTHELIARQGTTFNNHFVPLSLCCPSRATILTGLHAHNQQHGLHPR